MAIIVATAHRFAERARRHVNNFECLMIASDFWFALRHRYAPNTLDRSMSSKLLTFCGRL
jgi:hypothetical protein